MTWHLREGRTEVCGEKLVMHLRYINILVILKHDIMTLFTDSQIINRYQQEYRRRRIRESRNFSDSTILNENRQIADSKKEFDIFLSHSSNDNKIIAGLTLILQDLGYSVYVDWTDPYLDKNNVTPETASVLKERMKQCKSMIYAFSENATNSKWMPWELGCFDGLKNSRIAVLPISQTIKNSYKGTEFVGLYYYIQFDTIKGTNKKAIWVCDGDKYVNYLYWLSGKSPFKHT